MGDGTYHCDQAWLGPARPGDEGVHTGLHRSVVVEVRDGRVRAVHPGTPAPPGAVGLAGLTVPGLANAHSHAFHRALRGAAQAGRGTFWEWRDRMYALAGALDPDLAHDLARAVFAEMVLAGVTCVGEFHYVHHRRDGGAYADPNAMGEAMLAAATGAGIRITLLDTCYLEAGPGRPPEGVQVRFCDADADAWAARVDALSPGPDARVGAAVHSVRAVPPDQAAAVASWALARGAPVHVHLSEQPAENEACIAAYGRTPARVMAEAGVLRPGGVAVHATHLSEADRELLGTSGAGVCLCPTTERDLADGIGPAGALARAGVALSLGSDSQAVVDPWEEMRGLELDERLATGVRGTFGAEELLWAATGAGHLALGWDGAGRIAPGAPGDLVTVGLGSQRLAGADGRRILDAVVFSATASDVTDVVVGGRRVVADGVHVDVSVADELERAVSALRRAAEG